ncbi:hypothetical protein L1887_63304 [Cichorium endivia]|nr:hypothetical protein L1887_63304 [Cichorium endivia]
MLRRKLYQYFILFSSFSWLPIGAGVPCPCVEGGYDGLHDCCGCCLIGSLGREMRRRSKSSTGLWAVASEITIWRMSCWVVVRRGCVAGQGVQSQRPTIEDSSKITMQATGAMSWRRDNIKYRKNEAFVDVIEDVNLLVSANGTVLRADVNGAIEMRAYLSGMPECKFGLNDRLTLGENGADTSLDGGPIGNMGGNKATKAAAGSVTLEDVSLHQCVKLSSFTNDRTISFIPPDGSFQLMNYRATENVNLPFKVQAIVNEVGKSKVEYSIAIKANYGTKLFATNVVVKIPTPLNTADISSRTSQGKAKYEPSENAIVWKIARFTGQSEFVLSAEASLTTMTNVKAWSRPPLSMQFSLLMFTSSGLLVRYLKVFEKSNYSSVNSYSEALKQEPSAHGNCAACVRVAGDTKEENQTQTPQVPSSSNTSKSESEHETDSSPNNDIEEGGISASVKRASEAKTPEDTEKQESQQGSKHTSPEWNENTKVDSGRITEFEDAASGGRKASREASNESRDGVVDDQCLEPESQYHTSQQATPTSNEATHVIQPDVNQEEPPHNLPKPISQAPWVRDALSATKANPKGEVLIVLDRKDLAKSILVQTLNLRHISDSFKNLCSVSELESPQGSSESDLKAVLVLDGKPPIPDLLATPLDEDLSPPEAEEESVTSKPSRRITRTKQESSAVTQPSQVDVTSKPDWPKAYDSSFALPSASAVTDCPNVMLSSHCRELKTSSLSRSDTRHWEKSGTSSTGSSSNTFSIARCSKPSSKRPLVG